MRQFLIFFLLGVAAADFTGHRLVSINARTKNDLDFLDSLVDSPEFAELDFWTDLSVYQPIDVHVSPKDFGKFQQTLRNVGMTFNITNDNIQDMIDEEKQSMAKTPRAGLCDPGMTYCNFEEIEAWLSAKAAVNPDRMVLTVMNRQSFQGRNIFQVKIAEDLNNPKEAIWIEAGTHAREWIAVSSALGLIEKLLDPSNEMASLMMSRYDWYITPVHNPDGYAYTHLSSNNRLWRKNRQGCSGGVGTDLNRNWDSNHGGAGSSGFCFSDTYRGPSAFSAPETAALRDAVLSTKDVKAFFSVHCYSEYMLVPYGYTNSKPGRYAHLMDVADDMMYWLESVDGRYYVVGTPPDILYVASGGAYDYFYTQGIPYAYTYELRPKSGTSNGFVLPASQIPFAAEELFVSLWAFARRNDLNWDSESFYP